MDADYQKTPSAWLGALQIGDSIPRICEGLLVKTVADELHFENATHFSRAFK
jgi:AraC-like DNA-binding protein